MTQAQPERENANLVAKILTSKTYSKKLANQQMTYQFIQADQSQAQKLLKQVQINIPNKDINSCESDYTTLSMQMTVDNTTINSPYVQINDGNIVNVVQYKNALYCLSYDDTTLLASQVLKSFQASIENIDGVNTEDFGSFTLLIQVSQPTTNVVNKVSLGNSPVTTDLTDTPAAVYANTDASLYGQISTTPAVTTGVLSPNYTTNQRMVSAQKIVCYQKIMNLPYNSACFFDETALKHQNMEKDKTLQMQKRQIYRLQYCPNINQDFINQHWYEYYGNNVPQIIYSTIIDNTATFDFSFCIVCQSSKLWDLFQQDFLPLFKLSNPLNLTFQLNTALIQNMFKVKTQDSLGGTTLYDVQFIKYNQIYYYNIGMYVLNCSDAMVESKLKEELQSMEGIILPITQTYVEPYDSSIGLSKNFLISNGYNCLSWLELGLVFTNNRAYYSGYSTLKDIMGEYADYSQVGCQQISPQKDSYEWYTKQFSFFQPQVNINNKQLFIGSNYINSPYLFQIINNRGQDLGDSNPFTYNNYDYFNKLNIRLEQFTDKTVNNVEQNELNYSGYSLSKQQNNYFNTKIANYMVSNLQSGLTEAQSTDTILNGQKTFQIEAIYRSKSILKITRDGSLELMQQEYNL